MVIAMNKCKKLALLLCASGSAGLVHAENFDNAFNNATTTGQLRVAYISVKPDIAGSKTTTGAAVGGEIKIETDKWNNLQFAIAPILLKKLQA
jgi:hypothetical protein